MHMWIPLLILIPLGWRENKKIALGERTATNNTTINLLISRKGWEYDASVARMVELDAALAANLANDIINTIYVILDNATSLHNCLHFTQRLIKDPKLKGVHKLHCLDREAGQPTYREMFEAAFTLPEQKGVLVLSNADIVFDRTLNLMRGLPCNKMNVLSVKGGPQHASKNIRDIYLRYTSMSRKNLSRSKPPGKSLPWNLCTLSYKYAGMSWDAYIFGMCPNNNISLNKLEYIDTLKYHGRDYFMNELGAENAAAKAFRFAGFQRRRLYVDVPQLEGKRVAGKNRWHPNNACYFVNAWQFHLTRKTHHGSDEPITRNKWKDAGASLLCESLEECFWRNNLEPWSRQEKGKSKKKKKMKRRYRDSK